MSLRPRIPHAFSHGLGRVRKYIQPRPVAGIAAKLLFGDDVVSVSSVSGAVLRNQIADLGATKTA